MSRKSRPHRGEPGNHQEGVLMKPRGEMTDPLVAVGQQFLDVLKAIEELANASLSSAPRGTGVSLSGMDVTVGRSTSA
jgi:hypothetical protein